MRPPPATDPCSYLLSDGRHLELRVWICLCYLIFQYFLLTFRKVCLVLRQTETSEKNRRHASASCITWISTGSTPCSASANQVIVLRTSLTIWMSKTWNTSPVKNRTASMIASVPLLFCSTLLTRLHSRQLWAGPIPPKTQSSQHLSNGSLLWPSLSTAVWERRAGEDGLKIS